jgi:hypothetical protein
LPLKKKKKTKKQKETSVKPNLLKINPSPSPSFSLSIILSSLLSYHSLYLAPPREKERPSREKRERERKRDNGFPCVMNSVPKPLLLGRRWQYLNNKN